MKLQEYKKCCKIIDEVMLFFLRRGMHKIDIEYEVLNHLDILNFKIHECKKDSSEYFVQKLSAHHELQFEGFAWELMGDGDYDELRIVGGLIDELNTHYEGDDLVIRMVRRFE